MFKRNKSRLIISVLAICVSLSLVGTGFSLWVFISPETGTVAETKMNIEVASETGSGTFDARSLSSNVGPLKIALQGYVFPKMLIFEEGKRGGNPMAQGLSFYKIVSNENKPGEEHLFVPESPEFEKEHFLDDKILVTYYREADNTIEDLEKGGLYLKLSVSITISPILKDYITLFDTLKFEIPGGESLPDGSMHYVYDFTRDALLDGAKPTGTGAEYEQNVRKSLGYNETEETTPLFTPKAIKKEKTYEKYNYIMNLSHIFRWKSLDKKPTTVAAYNELKHLIENKEQTLRFSFKAEYERRG